MTSTTDFSKKQLATILSALDDAPRSPANKGEALRAIGRSAERFGPHPPTSPRRRAAACSTAASARPTSGSSCTTEGGAPSAARTRHRAPLTRRTAARPVRSRRRPPSPHRPPRRPSAARRKAKATRPSRPEPGKAAPADKPTPRAGTKQAQMIELLKRPEGATVEQIAAATGWQKHTIRGAISGALKKKLGPDGRGHAHPRGRAQQDRRQGQQHGLPDRRRAP